MRKLYTLQAFRGIAALLVLLYHGSQITSQYFGSAYDAGAFSFGYAGVDFFFVLSGFIITLTHAEDFGRPHAVAPYLLKRFVRVYPIYWILTLAVLPVYFVRTDFGRGLETAPWTILTSLLLIPQAEKPIIVVAWTLCHEIKFYLLFALAILLGWKTAKRLFLGMVTASVAFLIAEEFGRFSESLGFLSGFIFNAYNLEFALGCMCAWLVVHRPPRGPRLVLAFGIAGFAASALLSRGPGQLDGPWSILTFGVASALIALGAASTEIGSNATPNATPRVTRSPPSYKLLLFLGEASYSIYLSHPLALSVMVRMAAQLDVQAYLGIFTAGLVVVTGATTVGCLIHALLERPILDCLRHRVAVRTVEPV